MKKTYKITGDAAIRLAARDGLTLRKHADAGLVYILVTVRDWTDGADGYNVADYFTPSGRYNGPDEHGIEPIWCDAGGDA
jgi:hypothetical protein